MVEYKILICDHCHDERDSRDNLIKEYTSTGLQVIRRVDYIVPDVLSHSSTQYNGHLCTMCRKILKVYLLSFFGKEDESRQSNEDL